jgi:hypothetical protein
MSTQWLFRPGQSHQIQTLPNTTAGNSLRIFKPAVLRLSAAKVRPLLLLVKYPAPRHFQTDGL